VRLSDVLDGVTVSKLFQTVYGRMVTTHDVEINAVRTDSRSVTHGDLFVAVPGTTSDGHRFAGDAMAKGAKAIVLERDDAVSDPECMHAGVVKIVVPKVRTALARIAANAYGRPAEHLRMVGVTGTNGKTTTAHLISAVLQAGGERAATIGTIGIRYGDTTLPATHTTPDAVDLNRLLAAMRDGKMTAVSMEVSSHALDQGRVDGIPFACGVFTNLTQDHLDYHHDMERYVGAKKILFDMLPASGYAVVNADDPWTANLVKDTKAHVVTYGTDTDSDVRLIGSQTSVDGSMLEIAHKDTTVSVSSPLIGRFNVSNILAAFAAGLSLGIPVPALELGLASLKNVKGRFERVPSTHGWTAIIDYAHTPDALEKCLHAVRELLGSTGRIITVFGAGGDRDRGKRPLMGGIAVRLSDEVIVTSDNPRSEDPAAIIGEIVAGMPSKKNVTTEPDRHAAIALAATRATDGDVILIAGKGHEEVQVIGGDKHHFSDREEIEHFL